ncbi:hypothetical protein HAX54_004212, partial [Datura stramonium]|nr:hypothetical protein [Datura stramonium]
ICSMPEPRSSNKKQNSPKKKPTRPEYEQKVQAEFDQERRQWMIERGILNNRVVVYEEREVQMRQVIDDNHMWLQNCYLSMGKAWDQVLGLAIRAVCIHHDHNHQNDRSVGRQAHALVLQLPAVF